MYEAVALDLDGTLVDDALWISPYSQAVLARLARAGIEIIIATGRGLAKARAMTQPLAFHHTVIANNGALAQDEKGQRIFSTPLGPASSQQILDLGRDLDLVPFLYLDQEGPSLLVPDGYQGSYHEKSVVQARDWAYYRHYQGPLAALSLVFADSAPAISSLDQRLADQTHPWTIHWTNHKDPAMNLYEIQAPEATKAQGLAKVLAAKGIPAARCLAMGDDLNDLSMFQEVGLAIAMKNAVPAVKAQAHRTSLFTNNEDGVAKELAEVFQLDPL